MGLTGLAVVVGAYVWARTGDAEGGANIGAGLLLLVGIGIVISAAASGIVVGIRLRRGRSGGHHTP